MVDAFGWLAGARAPDTPGSGSGACRGDGHPGRQRIVALIRPHARIKQGDALHVVGHREDPDGPERERDLLWSAALSRRDRSLTCGDVVLGDAGAEAVLRAFANRSEPIPSPPVSGLRRSQTTAANRPWHRTTEAARRQVELYDDMWSQRAEGRLAGVRARQVATHLQLAVPAPVLPWARPARSAGCLKTIQQSVATRGFESPSGDPALGDRALGCRADTH